MHTRNVTERVARFSARRRWFVLGAWAVAVVASAAIAGLLGSALTTDDDFTGRPEAERAEQVLQRAFPARGDEARFRVDEAVVVTSSRLSRDEDAQRRLWELSEQTTRIRYP